MADSTVYTPLFYAARPPSGAELCKALLDAGATVGQGRNPLESRDEMKLEVVKMITGGL